MSAKKSNETIVAYYHMDPASGELLFTSMKEAVDFAATVLRDHDMLEAADELLRRSAAPTAGGGDAE